MLESIFLYHHILLKKYHVHVRKGGKEFDSTTYWRTFQRARSTVDANHDVIWAFIFMKMLPRFLTSLSFHYAVDFTFESHFSSFLDLLIILYKYLLFLNSPNPDGNGTLLAGTTELASRDLQPTIAANRKIILLYSTSKVITAFVNLLPHLE